jgi:hypothetical protein
MLLVVPQQESSKRDNLVVKGVRQGSERMSLNKAPST